MEVSGANLCSMYESALTNEHIIVNAIPDGTANDTNGEGEGGNRGNKVIWTDDGGCGGQRPCRLGRELSELTDD